MNNTMITLPTIRWQLLSTVSALALLGSAYAAEAAGNDADRPLIWIELGGQMENISGQGEAFAPAFIAANSSSAVLQSPTPMQAQEPPFAFGEEGKISFQPEGSDWVFAAAIRFGRSGNFRNVDHQTKNIHYKYHNVYGTHGLLTFENFANTKVHHKEQNAILDFSAGKDVGLGMLGSGASSTFNVGVRFAQFTSKESFDIRARPDLHFKYTAFPSISASYDIPYFNAFHATGQASRSFRGVGPSLSWNGSAPFVGNPQSGELTFDWGANAALLFGKQKARAQHHETGYYHSKLNGFYGRGYQVTYQNPIRGHEAKRSVTVPNVGGAVGLSWRVQDFKVSMGYRADFFFGAMDTGIDAVKKSNLTFNGPYASISIGIGD